MSIAVFFLLAIVLLSSLVQGATGFSLISPPAIGLFVPALLAVTVPLLVVLLNAPTAWHERHGLPPEAHRPTHT